MRPAWGYRAGAVFRETGQCLSDSRIDEFLTPSKRFYILTLINSAEVLALQPKVDSAQALEYVTHRQHHS